jgi:hypothetical protein
MTSYLSSSITSKGQQSLVLRKRALFDRSLEKQPFQSAAENFLPENRVALWLAFESLVFWFTSLTHQLIKSSTHQLNSFTGDLTAQ